MTVTSLPISLEGVKAGFRCVAGKRMWKEHDWQSWDSRYRRCTRCGEEADGGSTPVSREAATPAKRNAPRFTFGQQVWLTPNAHRQINPGGARNGVIRVVHRKRLGRRLYGIEIIDSYAKLRRREAYEDELTDESEAAQR